MYNFSIYVIDEVFWQAVRGALGSKDVVVCPFVSNFPVRLDSAMTESCILALAWRKCIVLARHSCVDVH